MASRERKRAYATLMAKICFSIFRAIPVSNHFSSPEYLSWGDWTERGWFEDTMKKGEIHFACGLPARALPTQGEFHGGYAAVRSGVCTMSGTAAYFHELQAGPTFFWAP